MAKAPLRFGTNGWRGVLGGEVTDARTRAVVHGAATWFRSLQRGRDLVTGRVLVGYDGRFASRRLAGLAADVLAERGLEPVLSQGISATPTVARAVRARRALGALVLTASHNPADDHGLKLFGPRGEAVADAVARRVEQAAERALVRAPRRAASRGRVRRANFVEPYAAALLARLDAASLRRARPRVFYDAMHGAGGGVLGSVLARAGARVALLRGDPDPLFGGEAPDPIPERLQALSRSARAARGLRLGIATDGDGDRVAACDETGRLLGDGEVSALLLDHLARSGRLRRGVALSLGCSSVVERMALAHGLGVMRRPVGFKHLSAALIEGAADVAMDESGGFAYAPFGVDKDGMLAGALLAELVASRRRGLGALLREVDRRFGRTRAARTALPLRALTQRGLERLHRRPPQRVGAARVVRVERGDGLWLGLEDGFAWLRMSGTEPVIRLYAEAGGPASVAARLAALRRLLDRAAG